MPGVNMPYAKLNPLDLFDVRAELDDDQRLVQEQVGRFVDHEVLPVIRSHFENHTFPRELVPGLASLGLLGSSLEGYGCAGLDAVSGGPVRAKTRSGRVGAELPVHVPDFHLRQ